MERERQLFATFLSMHAHKATVTEEPVAHLQFYAETMPPDLALFALTRDDVADAIRSGRLDGESELVRWLMEQLRTYDCRCERIVGLVFSKSVVLSEVLRVAPRSGA